MQSAAGAPWEGAAAMHPIGPYRDVRVALDLPSVAASERAVALKIAALDTQLRQLTPGADAFGPHTQRAPPDNGLGGMFGRAMEASSKGLHGSEKLKAAVGVARRAAVKVFQLLMVIAAFYTFDAGWWLDAEIRPQLGRSFVVTIYSIS